MVIRVSSAFIFQTFAEVCFSVFVNRSSFKSVLNLRKEYIFTSLLKVYYLSVFAESFTTFIFQKFRRPLCQKVDLPRCEARRRHFIMTCDIFGTGRTNILGLCYLFGKTYKQPTVAPLKSLKSTHSTKLLQHLCISQFHLRPAPPRADPQALVFFLPWMANSRGWGLLSCQTPRGGDEKRGQMPRPPSTLQHFSLLAQSNSAILSILICDFLF